MPKNRKFYIWCFYCGKKGECSARLWSFNFLSRLARVALQMVNSFVRIIFVMRCMKVDYLKTKTIQIKLYTIYSSHQLGLEGKRLERNREHSGRVLDSRPRGHRFSLTSVFVLCHGARHIYPCLVQIQTRKTCPDITEKLLTGT